MKRNPTVQYAVPTSTQIKRDLSNCDKLPNATQRWMCPRCNQQHINLPTYITHYRCHCGWEGNRHQLLKGEDNA